MWLLALLSTSKLDLHLHFVGKMILLDVLVDLYYTNVLDSAFFSVQAT